MCLHASVSSGLKGRMKAMVWFVIKLLDYPVVKCGAKFGSRI